MTWGAIGGAAIGLVGSAMTSGGGGSGQTMSKDPWAAAAPWLQANLASGQALQNQYTANPFSDTQKQAYTNQLGNSDYARSLTSSVLGQMNGFQPFDRNNPTARPAMFQFPQMPTGAPQGQPGGSMAATNPFMSAVLQPPPAQAPAQQPVAQQGAGSFARMPDGSIQWVPTPQDFGGGSGGGGD